jgi:hypothetical protein
MLVPEAEPPPFHVSGRRSAAYLSHSIMSGLLCIACIMGIIWATIFACLCVLLHKTNTNEVHTNCPGFWDFMLVSILSPLLLPLLYLLSSSALTISWSSFYTAWLVVMTTFTFATSLSATLNFHCMECLRDITPPFPWLIFVGWIKSVMYLAGTVSALRAYWK